MAFNSAMYFAWLRRAERDHQVVGLADAGLPMFEHAYNQGAADACMIDGVIDEEFEEECPECFGEDYEIITLNFKPHRKICSRCGYQWEVEDHGQED